MPPGRYLIGLNIWGGGPKSGAPYAESYARTAAGETVVALGFGGNVTLAPLVVRRLTQVAVMGTVRQANDRAAQGVELVAAMFGEHGRVYPVLPVKTDSDGRFQLRLWEGERYRIQAGPRFNPNADVEFVATDKPLSITLRER